MTKNIEYSREPGLSRYASIDCLCVLLRTCTTYTDQKNAYCDYPTPFVCFATRPVGTECKISCFVVDDRVHGGV